MFRRFSLVVVSLFVLFPIIVALSGCDELADAAHSAKGTASLQQRRQNQVNEAMNLVNDVPKRQ
jgi:hypothetical protein